MNEKLKRIRQILVALTIAVAVIGISSCEKYSWTPEVISEVDTVHFATEIQPIFTSKCISCHNGTPLLDLREGNSYQALTAGGFVDKPAASSKLYSKMISAGHASKSSDVDKQKVLLWIGQEAKNN